MTQPTHGLLAISSNLPESRHQQQVVYVYKLCLHRVRLEPLLTRLAQKRTAVVCPIVDAIDDTTLEFSRNGGYQVGGFSWNGHFTWEDVPARDKENRRDTDPVRYFLYIYLFDQGCMNNILGLLCCWSFCCFFSQGDWG